MPYTITVKAVCDRRPTGKGQEDQVHVHAKTILTVIFPRFNPAPVGRMARTGLALSRYSRKVQQPPRIRRDRQLPRLSPLLATTCAAPILTGSAGRTARQDAGPVLSRVIAAQPEDFIFWGRYAAEPCPIMAGVQLVQQRIEHAVVDIKSRWCRAAWAGTA